MKNPLPFPSLQGRGFFYAQKLFKIFANCPLSGHIVGIVIYVGRSPVAVQGEYQDGKSNTNH